MPLCMCSPHHSLRDQSLAEGPRAGLCPQPCHWSHQGDIPEPQNQGMVETTAGCGAPVQPPCSSKVIPELERISSGGLSGCFRDWCWGGLEEPALTAQGRDSPSSLSRQQDPLPRELGPSEPGFRLWSALLGAGTHLPGCS